MSISNVDQPLVTIIIPTYNRADLLPRALKSAISQTWQNLDILVVDDASPADMKPIIDAFDDDRIRYIRHETNKGGSGARNTGMDNAKGEFVAFLDDDDEYLSHKIEVLIEALKNTNDDVAFAYSQIEFHTAGGLTGITPRSGKSGYIYEDFLNGLWFQTNSTLVKRTHLKPYDSNLPRLQDTDFHLQMLKEHQAIYVESVTAIQHAVHGGERISSNPKALQAALKIFEGRYFTPPAGQKLSAGVIKGHAYFLRYVAMTMLASDGFDQKNAKKYLRKAFFLNPQLRTFGTWMSSLLGTKVLQLLRVVWFQIKLRSLKLFKR